MHKLLFDIYGGCEEKGFLIVKREIDLNKIKSMFEMIDRDIDAIEELKKLNKNFYNQLYKLNYDVIHTLVETLLLFNKIKSNNHQCLFAYLCKNYPELELDWNFFELIRTKRNGINYYGTAVNKDDWKQIELQSKVYINALKELIKEKINS